MSWPTKLIISDATLAPNPVNCNYQCALTVDIQEVEVIPYVVSPISGVFSSGQSIILPAYIVQASEGG